jgi:hypothetical protein
MKTMSRNFTRLSLIGLLIFGLCWGCAGVEKKFDDWQSVIREKLNFKESDGSETDARAEYFTHTAKWSWETLDYVAKWYTGDSKNGKKLAEINPKVNPEKIAVGSEVLIPTGLLTTREPLPKDFAGQYRNDYYKHTVRWPGESLSLIASWYTGSSKNWRKLAEVNPGLNPNRIRTGDVFLIPPALMKTSVPLPQKVAAKYTSHYFAYTVKKDNEKLEDIARWYTGNPANHQLLAEANPDLNPNHLTTGNEVFIPDNLLKTQAPIQSSQPAPSVSKPAGKVPANEPQIPPAQDEKIELFGPKQFPKS